MEKLKTIFRSDSKYKIFLLSILITGLSYGLYKGMLDNFLAEIVGMGEMDRGVAEFFRELPGIALVFILALFYMLSAETLYKVGAVIMLAGMGSTSCLNGNRCDSAEIHHGRTVHLGHIAQGNTPLVIAGSDNLNGELQNFKFPALACGGDGAAIHTGGGCVGAHQEAVGCMQLLVGNIFQTCGQVDRKVDGA